MAKRKEKRPMRTGPGSNILSAAAVEQARRAAQEAQANLEEQIKRLNLAEDVLQKKLDAFLEAYRVGDIEALKRLFTKTDPSYIGTGHQEFRHGHEEIMQHFRSDFKESRPEERVLCIDDVKALLSGTVMCCMVKITYKTATGPHRHIRLSGFLIEELSGNRSDWKWANLHFSFPDQHQSAHTSIPTPTFTSVAYEDLEEKGIPDSVEILFITANDSERNALLRRFSAFDKGEFLDVSVSGRTDYLGSFAGHKAVATMCKIGEIGASVATLDAIQHWNPKAVILVGVAGGTNPKNQRIGDVVVGEMVIPFNALTVDATGNRLRRPTPEPGPTLLSAFRHATVADWQYSGQTDVQPKVHYGAFLSSEQFIMDGRRRRELLDTYSNAKGIEMEAAGVSESAEMKGIEWIVVKSICDFANGSADNSHQQFAATVAVDLVYSVLERTSVIRDVPVLS